MKLTKEDVLQPFTEKLDQKKVKVFHSILYDCGTVKPELIILDPDGTFNKNEEPHFVLLNEYLKKLTKNKYVELSTLREIVESLKEKVCKNNRSLSKHCGRTKLSRDLVFTCDNCKEIDENFPPEILEGK